jgi:hypothetical protein
MMADQLNRNTWMMQQKFKFWLQAALMELHLHIDIQCSWTGLILDLLAFCQLLQLCDNVIH